MNANGYVPVQLTPNEVLTASSHACVRRWNNLAKIAKDRAKYASAQAVEERRQMNWDNDIQGSCAEMAFAKLMGQYWSGLAEIGAPDTAWGEVRWTRWVNTGGLRIWPNDDDDKKFVLMDGFAPDFRIIGWLFGKEGKYDDYWAYDERGRPLDYYLVPRSKLRPFEDKPNGD